MCTSKCKKFVDFLKSSEYVVQKVFARDNGLSIEDYLTRLSMY